MMPMPRTSHSSPVFARRCRARTLWLVATAVFLLSWQAAVFLTAAVGWDAIHKELIRWGAAGLFVLGLGWTVWLVERASQRIRDRRVARGPASASARLWNPLDCDAFYYGRQSPKLRQSLAVLGAYCLMFVTIYMVFTHAFRRQESYELPGGGGQPKALRQAVKIQKIVRTRYVVNPLSAIRFEVPPIDEVKLQLAEITEHAYTVGYGEGEGAGFGPGTARGMVRFIRLEYSGGDWDQDFGIGADLNMLVEYGIRTKHKVADRTESRRVAELANFPEGKSPPLVYLTGQRNIVVSNSEIRILNAYLVKKHGMLIGCNGGSHQFHNQFLALLGRVLPEVQPVPIPLDDVIHRVPYPIPFFPYVSPHGGKEALGWWLDGRWVCYYHPGDIDDAWADDHAGVRPEVWEACYQLGTNLIFYAHMEYAKWLQSQRKGR